MNWQALIFLGIAIEGILQFAAIGFGYKQKPIPTLGYTICFWIGRGARSAAIWGFTIFLTGRH